MTTSNTTSSPVGSGRAANARLILAVLFLVSVLNFVDRQILSILAGKIKADLLISDAQLGFLYGTVFGVFYSIFGVPLGVYADLGSRRKLIATGLALWSLMTMLSGLSTGFTGLALARVGVGVGEASASPAAYSLIADLFPKARRAAALAVYSLGVYVGIGLSLYLGGSVVDAWSRAYPAGEGPFGLRGWQAAFLLAGFPGLLLAPIVFRLREPVRGAADERGPALPIRPASARPGAARTAFLEGLALIPPFSFWFLRRDGVPIVPNARAFTLLAFIWAVLWLAFGDPVQWICMTTGLYVVATLAQRLKVREPDAFALIFETPSLRFATLGFSFLSVTGYVISFWTATFFIRYHGYSVSEIGDRLGLISALGGGFGVTMGGLLADRLRRKFPTGRLLVGMMTALLGAPFLLAALTVNDRGLALVLFAVAQMFAATWLGAGSSTVQDLVLPHMRARASAVFLLFVTLVSLALGPYAVGRLSDWWGELRPAFMAATLANLVAFILFAMAARTISRDEATKEARAAAARA